MGAHSAFLRGRVLLPQQSRKAARPLLANLFWFAIVFLTALFLGGCAAVNITPCNQPQGGACSGWTDADPCGTSTVTGWETIGVLALLISFFIVSLAYMLAEFMRSPELNAWAKNELYEVLISAFILASAFAFVLIATEMAEALAGGENHIEAGKNYLEEVKQTIEFQIYAPLLAIDFIIGILFTWGPSVPIPSLTELVGVIPIIGLTPFAGAGMLSNMYLFMLDALGAMTAVVMAQMAFLDYAAKFSLSLFLPLGIVMRTFPLTRKTGSTLIALAFTTFFVYPLTLVLNDVVFDSAFTPISEDMRNLNTLTDPNGQPVNFQNPNTGVQPNFGVAPSEAETEPGHVIVMPEPAPWWKRLGNMQNSIDNMQVNPIAPGNRLIFSFPGSPSRLWNYLFDLPLLYYLPLLSLMGALVVILPILDIIICITFFRSLSMAIGGEAQIMGLTKII